MSGNETYYAHGAGERYSLRRTSDTSATTRAMCVGIERPTLRRFARNIGSPTAQMSVVANLLPLLPDERTAVAFRFSVEGAGDWRIDDVYVDPSYR